MPVKTGLRYIEKWNESLEDQVVAYEKEECQKGQIVFYGSSSFTRWSKKYGMRPLREDILGASGKMCAINRGFGSSCSEHQLYYYPRMIRPLEPKVLVYRSDGNAAGLGYSLEEMWELAQRVIVYALTDFPDIHIYLQSPNPRRNDTDFSVRFRNEYREKLMAFCDEQPNCFFVDPYDYEPLLRKDIYVPDGIHFTQQGYDFYGEFYKAVLRDELAKY